MVTGARWPNRIERGEGWLNNVGVDPVTMKNQLGHADLSTTINYYVAGLQDAQLRAVDAMEEAFFKPVLGGGGERYTR